MWSSPEFCVSYVLCIGNIAWVMWKDGGLWGDVTLITHHIDPAYRHQMPFQSMRALHPSKEQLESELFSVSTYYCGVKLPGQTISMYWKFTFVLIHGFKAISLLIHAQQACLGIVFTACLLVVLHYHFISCYVHSDRKPSSSPHTHTLLNLTWACGECSTPNLLKCKLSGSYIKRTQKSCIFTR